MGEDLTKLSKEELINIIGKLKQQNKELKKNTISKNKIRNTIEQLKPFIYVGKNAPQDFLQYKVKAKIQVLEELLEENK